MSDAAASPKKRQTKAKKAKKPAAHPPVSSMVNAAIKNLKDRKGSSLAAIKKYIAANYKVDIVKISPFVRRYLKKAVTDGKLKQVKGTGASGSFRLGDKAEKAKKKPKAKKPKKPKKAKKPKTAKKAKSPKKAKKPKAEKAKKPKKPKSPKKASKPKAAKKPKAKKSPKKAAKKTAKK